MHELHQCLLSKTRYWTTLNGGLNKTYYYEDNLHLLENGNKKLALSIKTKLDNIRVTYHEITINEKEVPSLKTSDPTIKSAGRPDYQKGNNNLIKKLAIKLYHQKKMSNCGH